MSAEQNRQVWGTVGGPAAPRPLPTWRGLALAAAAFTLFYVAFFAPVLFGHRYLAPGDGLTECLPAFLTPHTLWSDALYCGYPAAADPIPQTWYPPHRLFAAFGAWNAFMVFAYVLASLFTFGYLRAMTGSALAGTVAGLAYGLSGFLIAHLGHSSMVHSAIWFPLLVWSLEELRRRPRAAWIAAGALAVGFSALAGNVQVLVFILFTAGLYAVSLAPAAPAGTVRFLAAALAAVVAGLAIGAVQLLPTAELLGLGVRAHMDFGEYVTYALPPSQLSALLLPNLFGAPYAGRVYPVAYFGAWNWCEVAGYVGLLPLMLALPGALRGRPRSVACFWAAMGLLALALAIGEATPLARLMYHVPPFNKARAPARHVHELALAAAVLAGLGIDAVAGRRAGRRAVIAGGAAVSALVALAVLVQVPATSGLHRLAAAHGIAALSLSPARNRAVAVPLAVLMMSLASAIAWSRRPSSRSRTAALLAALVLDLGSYAWLAEWRRYSPDHAALEPPPHARRYAHLLAPARRRLLPISGAIGSANEIKVNQSRLWGIASASGYGPFQTLRYHELLGLVPAGGATGEWWLPERLALDLLGVRYVLTDRDRVPRGPRRACLDAPAAPGRADLGIGWAEEDLDAEVGRGGGRTAPDELEIDLPVPRQATALALVTSLACAHHLKQGADAAWVDVFGEQGMEVSLPLRAGVETAEGRYACTGGGTATKHARPPVLGFGAQRTDPVYGTCADETFLAVLELDRPIRVQRVVIRAVTRRRVRLRVVRATLLDDDAGVALPLHGRAVERPYRKFEVAETVEATTVFENTRVLPAAWLVAEATRLDPDAVRDAVLTSRLPDGTEFDPRRLALVEEPIDLPGGAGSGKVALRSAGASTLAYAVHAERPSLLVLSEPYYPGWRARIDGRPAPVLRADYVLRAVAVPAGDHEVTLRFLPTSLILGAGLALASALALGIAVARSWREDRRRGGERA